MNHLVTSQGGIMAAIACAVALALWIQRFKIFKTFGPALMCIIVGLLLGSLNILPHWHDIYALFFTYAIPMSITMVLLTVDFKEWVKLSKQPLFTMLLAVLSVSIVTMVAGYFFAPGIEEGWKVAGMFVGTYTGGSANLTAIGSGLGASPTTFASANAADYVVGIPIFICFFALPGILSKSTWFQNIWPHTLTDEELETSDEASLFETRKWSVTDIALLFGIAFATTEIATIMAKDSGALRIILVTTIAILLAQFKPVKQIKGSMDLGVYVALFFLVVIGLLVDLEKFASSAPSITLFCLVVVLGSLTLHVSLCRLFKLKYQYVLISIVAALGDGTSAALVASAGNWKSIMGIAIVLGVFGVAVGNYVGIAVAYSIKAILGL